MCIIHSVTDTSLHLVFILTLTILSSSSESKICMKKNGRKEKLSKISGYTWKYETAFVHLNCSFIKNCCQDKEAIQCETHLLNLIIKSISQCFQFSNCRRTFISSTVRAQGAHTSPNITHTPLCRSILPCPDVCCQEQ